MLAFLKLFLKFYLWIRHTDEMRSILEVGSEQLLENGIKTTGSSIVQMKILSFLGCIDVGSV